MGGESENVHALDGLGLFPQLPLALYVGCPGAMMVRVAAVQTGYRVVVTRAKLPSPPVDVDEPSSEIETVAPTTGGP